MSLVATLIGAPAAGTLTQHVAERAAMAVDARHLYFLADGIACDIVLPHRTDAEKESVRQAVRDVTQGLPLDVIVQPQETRRKRLLVADMDSTMIEQECIDELAAEAGVGERVSDITAAAMRGELNFEAALRERVALLRGLPTGVVADVLERRITDAPGAQTLIATMLAHGAYTALVSGGFTAFTEVVGRRLGFDENRANVLEVADGRLSGTVREPVLGSNAKVDALKKIAASRGLRAQDAIAVGDGANDLAMIQLAGTGVALHAKPIVAEAAPHRVEHGDLTALLYMQGYRATDFR